MNIVLTGFMGTGKTAVGRLVAERLGWLFFDTDEMIEKQTGLSIADLFAKGGEASFRDLEAQTVGLVSLLDKAVIATGGGVPLRASNMEELERNGRVFLLTASPDAIFRRLQFDALPRPLLAGSSPRERIEALLRERETAYGRCRDKIDTEGLTERQVADAVIKKMGLVIKT